LETIGNDKTMQAAASLANSIDHWNSSANTVLSVEDQIAVSKRSGY
jgi:hypothetical protein